MIEVKIQKLKRKEVSIITKAPFSKNWKFDKIASLTSKFINFLSRHSTYFELFDMKVYMVLFYFAKIN